MAQRKYNLKSIFKKCGIEIKNNQYHTSCTRSQLINVLKSVPWNADQLKEFFSELLKIMSDEIVCVCMFSGISFDHETTDSFGTPDSLFRILFELSELHTHLISLTIELVLKFDSSITHDENHRNISMILTQLRWLSKLSDQNHLKLVDKLLELIDVVQLSVKSEIILFLPDIISCDTMSSLLGEKLNFALISWPDLANVIFDSLARIQLEESAMTEIIDSALQLLDSDNLNSVGPILNFILKFCPLHLFNTIVLQLRLHFNLEPRSCIRTSTPFSEPTDLQLVIAETIYFNFMFRQGIVEIWLAAMLNLGTKEDGSNLKEPMFDWLVMLTCFQTAAPLKKDVLSALKHLICMRYFTRSFVRSFTTKYKSALLFFFKGYVKMAQTLINSKAKVCFDLGGALLSESFGKLDENYRYDIICMLVVLVGSQTSSQINVALDALLFIVKQDIREMRSFSSFVKSMLDFVEKFSHQQVKQLYEILARIAFDDVDGPSHHGDDLLIIVQKQLCHASRTFQAIGVVGALVLLPFLICKSPNSSLSQSQANHGLAMIRELLKAIRLCYTRSPFIGSLFMDELSQLVHSNCIKRQVEKWICEIVTDDFQKDFIVDNAPLNDSIPTLGLDPVEACGIAVSVAPLWRDRSSTATTSTQQDAKEMRLLCLPAHFRLIAICEGHLHEGNLQGVDALLSCPLLLSPPDLNFAKPDVLLVCINWCIELVNAFVRDNADETRGKVLLRMRHVCVLRNHLKHSLARHPETQLPVAKFHENGCERISAKRAIKSFSSLTSAKHKVKATKVGKRKRKRTSSEDEGLSVTEDGGLLTAADIDLNQIAECFREFDLDVLKLLGGNAVVLMMDIDSANSVEAVRRISLEFAEQELLLRQLTQLHVRAHIDDASDDTSHVMEIMMTLIGDFCTIVDNVFAFLSGKRTSSADESAFTLPLDINPEQHLCVSSCLAHVLDIVYSLIESFDKVVDNGSVLKLLGIVVGHSLNSAALNAKSLEWCAVEGALYFAKLVPVVPDIYCAKMLASLISRLVQFDPAQKRVDVFRMSLSLLNREWEPTFCWNGRKFKDLLFDLLVLHFHVVGLDERLLFLANFVNDVLTGSAATADAVRSDKYGSLCRATFDVYYRAVAHCLQLLVESKLRLTLEQWNSAIQVVNSIAEIARNNPQRVVLDVMLRLGRAFLGQFNKQAMPLLDEKFFGHRNACLTLLRNVQSVTRFLQRLCTHVKSSKAVGLVRFVPQLKRVLEQLIFRVRSMLVANRCTEAFWMGNLKNRDLQGEEIVLSDDEKNDENEASVALSSDHSDISLDRSEDGLSEDARSDIL